MVLWRCAAGEGVMTVCPTGACNFTTIAEAVGASQNLDELLLMGNDVNFTAEPYVNINSSIALTITYDHLFPLCLFLASFSFFSWN
jgi:hypothetical protein